MTVYHSIAVKMNFRERNTTIMHIYEFTGYYVQCAVNDIIAVPSTRNSYSKYSWHFVHNVETIVKCDSFYCWQ